MTKAIYSLDELAIKYGTDKSSLQHSYTQYYELFFSELRWQKIKFLEIGIDSGSSMKMWRHYFPHSEIHGIDIRGDYEYLHEVGIKTHIVDQSSEADLVLFGEQYDQYFDIIVCDGSHMSSDDILTFEILFKYLKPGGYWCNEDLLCDFDPRWNTGQSSLARYKKVIDEVNMSDNISHDNLCSNKTIASKKYGGSYFDKNVQWLFASTGLVIIKKMP